MFDQLSLNRRKAFRSQCSTVWWIFAGITYIRDNSLQTLMLSSLVSNERTKGIHVLVSRSHGKLRAISRESMPSWLPLSVVYLVYTIHRMKWINRTTPAHKQVLVRDDVLCTGLPFEWHRNKNQLFVERLVVNTHWLGFGRPLHSVITHSTNLCSVLSLVHKFLLIDVIKKASTDNIWDD